MQTGAEEGGHFPTLVPAPSRPTGATSSEAGLSQALGPQEDLGPILPSGSVFTAASQYLELGLAHSRRSVSVCAEWVNPDQLCASTSFSRHVHSTRYAPGVWKRGTEEARRVLPGLLQGEGADFATVLPADATDRPAALP